MQLLHSNGRAHATARTITAAAAYGQLATAKQLLLLLPRYDLGAAPMTAAVERGDFDMLLTLQEDGRFSSNMDCFLSALREKHYKIFQWLVHEYSDVVPGLRESAGVVGDVYFQDCLNEMMKPAQRSHRASL